MTKEDILHLAHLSRIRLTEVEADEFTKEIDAVLTYVSEINAITAGNVLEKKPGVRSNVFREDVVTNAADSYTQTLLNEAPAASGRHFKVKKILNID